MAAKTPPSKKPPEEKPTPYNTRRKILIATQLSPDMIDRNYIVENGLALLSQHIYSLKDLRTLYNHSKKTHPYTFCVTDTDKEPAIQTILGDNTIKCIKQKARILSGDNVFIISGTLDNIDALSDEEIDKLLSSKKIRATIIYVV